MDLRQANPIPTEPTAEPLSDRARLELAHYMAEAAGAETAAPVPSARRPVRRFVVIGAATAAAFAAGAIGVLNIPGQTPAPAEAVPITAHVVSATTVDAPWGQEATLELPFPSEDGFFGMIRLAAQEPGGQWFATGDELVFEPQDDGSFLLPSVPGFPGPFGLRPVQVLPSPADSDDPDDKTVQSFSVSVGDESDGWSVDFINEATGQGLAFTLAGVRSGGASGGGGEVSFSEGDQVDEDGAITAEDVVVRKGVIASGEVAVTTEEPASGGGGIFMSGTGSDTSTSFHWVTAEDGTTYFVAWATGTDRARVLNSLNNLETQTMLP